MYQHVFLCCSCLGILLWTERTVTYTTFGEHLILFPYIYPYIYLSVVFSDFHSLKTKNVSLERLRVRDDMIEVSND